MPGESGNVIGLVVAAEVVQQQEGIELGGFPKPEGAPQPYAGALDGGNGLKDLPYGAKRHRGPPLPYLALDAQRKYLSQQVFCQSSEIL
jgi:hypothetical protein